MIEHKFALGIKKISEDGKNWTVTVGSKSEGVAIEEAVFYVEGSIRYIKHNICITDRHFSHLRFEKSEE